MNITALQFTHYIRLKKQSCLNEELAECVGNCIENHNSYHKSYNKEIFERKKMPKYPIVIFDNIIPLICDWAFKLFANLYSKELVDFIINLCKLNMKCNNYNNNYIL